MSGEVKKTFSGVKIFTDGGCIGNPGPGGWSAVIEREGRYGEFGGFEPATTNNRMEMKAAIEALKHVEEGGHCLVVTDSKYLVDGASKWLRGWKKKGWRKSDGEEVLNLDLWRELDGLISTRKVLWEHVRGHAGHPENERCDKIANSFARGDKPELKTGDGSWIFAGGKEDAPYPSPLYLSCVDGAIEEHKSWVECEARIKGVRGSKCRKVKTRSEHIAAIADWEDK
ncbi:ribonuclease HI [bacterium]|nr:MAG: ribonuclease HI [bacterium]